MKEYDHIQKRLSEDRPVPPVSSAPSFADIHHRIHRRTRRRRTALSCGAAGALAGISFLTIQLRSFDPPFAVPRANEQAVDMPPATHVAANTSDSHATSRSRVEENQLVGNGPQEVFAETTIPFTILEGDVNGSSTWRPQTAPFAMDTSSSPPLEFTPGNARVMATFVQPVPVLKATTGDENTYELLGWARDVEVVPIEMDALPEQTQSHIHQVLESDLPAEFWTL